MIAASGGASCSTFIRWCKFNLVGGMGIVVQFAALFVLRSVLKFDYLFATAIAVEAAVIHNFVWHEQFTWADRTKIDRTTFARLLAVQWLARDPLMVDQGARDCDRRRVREKINVGPPESQHLARAGDDSADPLVQQRVPVRHARWGDP